MIENENSIRIKKIGKEPGKGTEAHDFVFNQNPRHKLGEGAFGEVFLGFDNNNKGPVAVKVVSFQKL